MTVKIGTGTFLTTTAVIEQNVSWRKRLQARIGFPAFVGYYHMVHGGGPMPFYLGFCGSCKKFSVVYKEGFNRELRCRHCPLCFPEQEIIAVSEEDALASLEKQST